MTIVPEVLMLATRGDSRGWLIAIEGNRDVPFAPLRVYYIGGTDAGVRRGLHAHLVTRQAAICVQGACSFMFDDGRTRTDVRLDRRDRALFIPPMVWHEMFDFSSDCVLLVLADTLYDEADYVRDYDSFRRLVEASPT